MSFYLLIKPGGPGWKKFAIANGGDKLWDSGLFLKAQSFISTKDSTNSYNNLLVFGGIQSHKPQSRFG